MSAPIFTPPEGLLTPLELFAAAVACKQETKHHADLRPGVYPVDVTIRCVGTLSVAKDAQIAKTERPTELELVSWLLQKFGAMQRIEIANTTLLEFIGETIPQAVAEQAERLIENLKTKTTASKKGAVTGLFEVSRA